MNLPTCLTSCRPDQEGWDDGRWLVEWDVQLSWEALFAWAETFLARGHWKNCACSQPQNSCAKIWTACIVWLTSVLCSHIPLPWPDATNCRRHGNKTSRRGVASMHLVYVCCFLAFIFSIFQPPISPQPQFSSLQLSHFCFDSVRSIGFLAIKHFECIISTIENLRLPNHQPPVLWFAMLLLKIERSFLQMSSWFKQSTAQIYLKGWHWGQLTSFNQLIFFVTQAVSIPVTNTVIERTYKRHIHKG